MNRLRSLAAVVFLAALAGCAPTRNALPAGLVGRAEVVDIPDVRAWGDEYSPVLQASLTESIRKGFENPGWSADAEGYVDILSLSGGGSDGAFGAGLLNGWSANGARPAFKLVTGISAGALIAPFAFLGSDYDGQLKELCTKFKAEEVFTLRPLLSLLGGEQSLADTAPLARLIARLVDEDFLAAVAKAHRQGRRLLIGTTNLDAPAR